MKHLFTALLLLCTTMATAHNFVVNGIYYNILSTQDKTVEVTYKGNSYYGCEDRYMDNVVIPEKVTYNGSTYKVTGIGDEAFRACLLLKSIQMPNSIEFIDDYAFSGCSGLKSIELSSSVTTIGWEAFASCKSLTSIEIPDGVTTIKDFAFRDCYGFKSIKIPNTVTYIGSGVFSDCNSLENVEFSNSVTYIGSAVFFGCTSLTNFEIPSTLTSTGYEMFAACSNLVSVSIPNSITRIEYKTFSSCTSLASVEIPSSVTSIGGLAFNGCKSLSCITSLIPAEKLFTPEYSSDSGLDVFYGVDKTKCVLYVPYGAKETYAATKGWSEFANIVELERPSIKISVNQYGSATYCSQYALDFSEVDGLKAYSAIGYKPTTQTVTLARVMTTGAGQGIFIKGEPGEYKVPIIDDFDEYTLNLLVGTLEQTTVNSTDGKMSNYKFTITDGDAAP
ncbi:MAG: leucine-rich repeat domain-containing protein, partial [Bacteroidaceae bacterium]|nr:leucine-rich repeat domain-containing protein [Bacteroidaceae bacterium]